MVQMKVRILLEDQPVFSFLVSMDGWDWMETEKFTTLEKGLQILKRLQMLAGNDPERFASIKLWLQKVFQKGFRNYA